MLTHLYDLMAVVGIPFIIELLKKINLPTKVAPFVAIGLAAAYVAIAKWLGFSADFQSAFDYLVKALGIGAVGVFGYDVVKLLKK